MRLLSACVFAAIVSSCGGTEQSRRIFPIAVTGTHQAIVTDSGWSVTLTRAHAHLEAVRFFSGKVLLSRRPAPWWKELWIGTAWAHPGHYVPGEALGERVASLDVDLLASEPAAWGDASAVTGTYGSAQLTYGAPGFELEGTATKNGTSITFSAQFTPPTAVAGVRFEHEMTTAPGAVAVELDLSAILSRVDFAQIGASAKPLDPSSPAFNGLGRGVEDTSAYVFTWKEN